MLLLLRAISHVIPRLLLPLLCHRGDGSPSLNRRRRRRGCVVAVIELVIREMYSLDTWATGNVTPVTIVVRIIERRSSLVDGGLGRVLIRLLLLLLLWRRRLPIWILGVVPIAILIRVRHDDIAGSGSGARGERAVSDRTEERGVNRSVVALGGEEGVGVVRVLRRGFEHRS